MPAELKEQISEFILNRKDLVIIISVDSITSTVLLGTKDWEDKVSKLIKIVKHTVKKGQIPSMINLRNSKKVVVKFTDNF